MKVYDFEIFPAVDRACVERMMRGDSFIADDIVQIARECGVPNSNANPVAYRLADRLIQRERKAGKIKRFGKRWRPML